MAGFNDLKKKYHIQEKETKTKTYTLDDGKKYKVNVLGTDDAAKVGSNKFRSERFETLIEEKKNDVRNRPDYAEVSKRGRTNYQQLRDDKTSNWFGNWVKDTYAGKLVSPMWEKYSEDEKDMYGYLYETDKDKANKYMLELNKSYEAAEREATQKKVSEWAEDKPGLASVSSLVANVGAPIDYIRQVGGGMATEELFGEGVVLPTTGYSGYAKAMQEGVQNKITENTNFEIAGANVAAQLYGIGMSVANSAALIAAMGPLAAAEMSMQAAASATMDAIDRGVSDAKAVQYGTLAGAAEALGEYLSIEHLFKLEAPHSIKQAVKAALSQAGFEASEEVVTTLMNTVSDFVVNGDKSEYATNVAFYLSEGYSQKEAEKKATWDGIKGLVWDAIGGAVSGLILGGGTMALGGAVGSVAENVEAEKAVKGLGKDKGAILDYAMEAEEGSEGRKAAEDIKAKTEKGEAVSNREYAEVLKKANEDFEIAEIKKQIKAEAMSTGEAITDEQIDAMSKSVLKTIKGKMVSEQENVQIEQSQSAKNVYARNTGRDYTYGEGLSGKEARTLKESRDKQIISEYAEDQDGKYAKELTDAYVEYYAQNDDNRAMLDVESFAEMFGSFYESGKVGYTSVDKALNTYKNIDANLKNAFSKAYELGKADLEADNVAQNEFRQAAAKKGVEGKIVFEGEARRVAKNKQQTTALEFMGRVLKKSSGIEYHIFASYVLDKDFTYTNKEGKTVELKAGSRVYKDKNGETVSAPSGFYDAESRQIWVDLNAGAEGIGLMLDTLTHEHVHDIRVWSYEHYKQLLDITKKSVEARGVDFDDVVAEMYDLYHNKKNRKDYTIEKAKEEVVAKTMSGLLRDENGLREFSQQVYAKDKTLWEKIKDWFADVVARLTNAYKDVDLDSALAQNLKDQKELYEKAQKVFAEAIVTAGQNYKVVESGAFKGLYKTTEGNSDVYVTDKGNVIAVSEKGNANNVMYNIGEYDNGGRDYLEKWLTKAVKKKDVSQDVKNQMLQAMDNAAELVRDLEKSFPVFKEWGEVSLAYDDSGKPVMRCKVKNGDYEINFDFSTVCKKRKGLDAVLNNLIKTGKIDLIDLSRSDIQFINETLDKYDFEIACALCFVDSKRYRVGEWASGAATMYNDLINSLVKPEDLNKISSFNFGGNKNKNIIEGDISTWDDSRLDFSTLKEILASDSRAGGMGYKKAFAKLIIENPKYRKFLSSSDIVSSRGTDRMRNEANDLLEAVNAIGGSSKPKMSNSESVWDHSILMDKRVTAKSSFAMGGARTQSFSDFIATMFFDYCQMFAEAQAKGLPMQAYTKELAFAELFGLTGARINLSVLHGVKISAEDRAWLDSKYVANKDGELELNITTKADKERLEAIKRNAGLDENGNYVPEKQSIDFDKAISLQNRNGYSRYLGTIVVGVSERHIWKLLDDMRVRMIIPYHKSGLSPVIAKARNIDCYTDFTLSQNTRLGESWGEDAGKTIGSTSLSDEGNKRLKAIKDAGKKWNFYSVLHKYEKDWDTATNSWKEGTNHAETITYELSSNGKNVFQNDPMRQTCEDYFAWCVEYDMIPQFDQFMKHPNYYKMQEDFDVYDCITGEYVPQTAVEFKLPDNAKEVLETELKAQQETSDRLNEMMPKMVDEIVNTIGRKIPPEIKIGKMMDERDSDGRMLSKEQQNYFKNSVVRDKEGRLLTMYHGTANGGAFTIFEGDKLSNKTLTSQIGQGFYFTNVKKSAKDYMKNRDVWGKVSKGTNPYLHEVYLNITNPINIKDSIDIDAVKAVYMEGDYDWFFDSGLPHELNNRTVNGVKLTNAEVQAMTKEEKVSLYVDYLNQVGGTKELLQNMPKAFHYNKQSGLLEAMKKHTGHDGIVDETMPGLFQYVAFSSEQIKKVDNKTPTADPDIRYDERDSEYMEAIKKADIGTMQKLVEEAAKEAGYTEKLYHGTNRFGFTVPKTEGLEPGMAWSPFFATDSEEVAQTYSGVGGTRWIADDSLSEENIDKAYEEADKNVNDCVDDLFWAVEHQLPYTVDFSDLSNYAEELADGLYMNKISDSEVDENLYDYVAERVHHSWTYARDNYGEYEDYDGYLDWVESEDAEKIWGATDKLTQAILNYVKARNMTGLEDLGNYELYANVENLFEIDAKGKAWNQIPFDEYDTNGFHPRVTTRELAAYAKNEGYKGVKITNVYDDGGRGKYQTKPATVYIFFNPQEQIKSADPVTKDDNGNVIPLSERFKKENDDIRYDERNSDYAFDGRKAVMTKARINYLIEDSGAGSRVDYAQAWITSISPTDYLNLTTDSKTQNREVFDKFGSEWDPNVNMGNYDYLGQLGKTVRQTPYLAIDINTGKVVGHDGRHRIRALEKEGIKSVEIMVEFREDGRLVKYEPDGERWETLNGVRLTNQFGTGQKALIENVIPLNEDHRSEIEASYGKMSHNRTDIMYDERIETFDDQILALERQNKKLIKEMENLMRKYEAAQDRAKKNILAGQMAQGKKDAEQLRKTTEKYQGMVAARDQKLEQQSKDFKEALKAKDKESKLAQDYAMAEGVLAGQMAQGAEDAKVIREIEGLLQKKKAELKKVRERRDEILEEKRQAYAAYREKTRESIASGGLKKSIEKNAKTLYEWLMKNSDKEHVPEVLKTTVGDFLESIDFTSKRGLAGGEATKKDQAFAKRLNNLAAMLEKQRNYMNKANDSDAENPLDCFLDLPEGFAEEIRKLADDVAKTAIGGNFVVNEMNSAQLAQLNQALRVLKTSISKMNKLITNAHFASVTEAARSSMLEMAEFKEHKPQNDLSEQADKMLRWEMFTPVYAFKRYGKAGESIFKGIQKGWSDFAFAIDKVLKFTQETYTDKEVEVWEKETHSIKLSDGNTVTLTSAQLMSLYCLNKREQARGHIYGGGIRIADIKAGKAKLQQTEPYLVSFEDVETLLSELSDRQIAVADKLQKFMTEQGSEWGNKVSMERFGYRAFTEDNYFPIESDANNLIAIDPEAKANDMFRLLNMSATKSLTKGANNAIVISDIFDIFSNHMSDMAKYGTLALPILDTMKWYNYKVRYDVGDGQFRTETVQKSVERAYGKAGKSYFTTFMKDLNGVKEGGRGEGFARKMVSNYKIASVGANIRVALLQPSSIVRASMEIEPKYILQALTKLPAAKKAESKSGVALWKALGFYNTDIARGVREQIKGGGKTIDKIRDKSMILAKQMDRITFGTLWNAAEAKAKDLGYSGNELEAKTVEIFDEIVYKTQVVDSTLTRSSLMRSSSMFVSSTMAFMAEPTLSYNMVAENVFDMAKENDFATGWKKQGKKFEKAIAVYAASSLAAAIIESIPDAIRDDDDEEWFGWKWWQAFWGEKFFDGNLVSEFNILEKIPLLKDFISLRKGYDLQRLDAAWLSSLNKAFEIDQELINVYIKGEKPTQTTYWGKMTGYGAAYANLRALSQIAGLPVSNAVRDVVAIWNTIVGGMAPSLKLKTYDDSKKK